MGSALSMQRKTWGGNGVVPVEEREKVYSEAVINGIMGSDIWDSKNSSDMKLQLTNKLKYFIDTIKITYNFVYFFHIIKHI